MKTGVLLIATGHKNYFRMAQVLAASIRVNDPEIKICIATDGKHLVDMSLFDQFVQIDEKYLTEPIKAKVFMNMITPFEETLFLVLKSAILRRTLPVSSTIPNLYADVLSNDVTSIDKILYAIRLSTILDIKFS